MSQDSYLAAVTVWATIQLSWTIVLLAGQLWQVARQMTTLEVSNLGRYGFMGGRGSLPGSGQQGHQHAQGEGMDGNQAHGQHHHKKGGVCGGAGGFLMQILGFDRYTKGKAADGLARASKASNPFDLGFIGNCRDFWTRGRELGVEYDRLYDVPPEGFHEAKKRREQDDEDFGQRPKRKGIFMGLGLGRGAHRDGYLPVRSEDQV
jgi:palmitoyltransferase ZDHHC13/17